MPWIYCYLPMNHIEERLSLLHFWIWEGHSILFVMPCCCSVFINWVFAVLKFSGSPQWLCPVSKAQSLLLWLVTCFVRNSPREYPGTPLILIYVNDMLLQIQNGSLLQFADNTCLICYGDDHTQVKDFLSSDLDSLARWIATSKMQEKSRVMWFSVKSFNSPTTVPPVLLEVLF